MSDLDATRRRILLPFEVSKGSHVWAPWGLSGWSAVEISKTSRKWAKGFRVKPNTGERGADAKIPMSRLLRRDPDLAGKDKPTYAPDEVFTTPTDSGPHHHDAAVEPSAKLVVQHGSEHSDTADTGRPPPPQPQPQPSQLPNRSRLTDLERSAAYARLLALFPPDDSGDW